jgi:TatD DNase family protein
MTLEFFDSHVHETLFPGETAPEWRERMRGLVTLGMRGMLVPAAAPEDWETLLERSAQAAQIVGLRFAGFAIGLHPWCVDRGGHDGSQRARDGSDSRAVDDDALASRLAQVVGHARREGAPLWAIGECGLDTGRRFAPRARQLAWVARHVELARQHDLPLVLHAVGGLGTLLAALDELRAPPSIVHGFTGAPEMALAYVRRGHRLGFGRALLDPRAERARASACAVPAHALLLETDTPARPMPAPFTAATTTTIVDVARALATVRDVSLEEIAATTWHNALVAFGIGGVR